MNRIVPLLLLAALAAPAAPAAAFDPVEVAAARRAVDAAMNAGDAAQALAARGRFAALAAAEPDSPLLHYWVGYASWRALPLVQRTSKDEAKRIGLDGVAHLDRALALDPRFGEAWALKGGLQGMLIGAGGGSPMTLGPESEKSIARGEALDPASPRVALLAGIGTLHKPGILGGGPKKALPHFAEARARFEREAVADSTRPAWGRDDVHVWTGIAHSRAKRWSEAREAYLRALEINPDHGWVRTQLLPEIERRLQKAGR